MHLPHVCGFAAENKVGMGRSWIAKVGVKSGYPPPPIPLKALLGAGFAKSVCKILMSNNLEIKI